MRRGQSSHRCYRECQGRRKAATNNEHQTDPTPSPLEAELVTGHLVKDHSIRFSTDFVDEVYLPYDTTTRSKAVTYISRGVDSSHATWTRVRLESLFLWLVTWLGLAKKWLATWLGLAKIWLATWLGLAKIWLATWLGLARKWLVTNARPKLLERPRDLINF